MPPTYDNETFQYKAANGFQGICRVRIFKHQGEITVLVTELIDPSTGFDLNPGPSITNSIEAIASALSKDGIH